MISLQKIKEWVIAAAEGNDGSPQEMYEDVMEKAQSEEPLLDEELEAVERQVKELIRNYNYPPREN
ncbi:MAG: hypothetical protein EOP04_00490 [Proteobacteria bacterium]|nr:MAG: hypothetical protein EOP04_00490 [Pseudomonadota bacterium]